MGVEGAASVKMRFKSFCIGDGTWKMQMNCQSTGSVDILKPSLQIFNLLQNGFLYIVELSSR